MQDLSSDFIDAVKHHINKTVEQDDPAGVVISTTKQDTKQAGNEAAKLGKAAKYMELRYVQYTAINIVGLGSDFYEYLYFSDEAKKDVIAGGKSVFIEHCLKEARIPSPCTGKQLSFGLPEVTKAYMRLRGYACWDNEVTKPDIENYKIHKPTSSAKRAELEADENMVRIQPDRYMDVTLRTATSTVPQHVPLPEAYINNAMYIGIDDTPLYVKKFMLEALHAFNELKTENEILAWCIKTPITEY